MKKKNENEAQKTKTSWVLKLFLILMPLVILGVVVVFVLHVAGYNSLDWVKEQGKSIPVVGEMFMDEEEKQSVRDTGALQEQLERKEAQLKEKDDEINNLQETIVSLEDQVSTLQNEVDEMMSQALHTEQNEATETETAPTEKDTMIVTLEGMKSKQAAAILEELENDLAVSILEEMSAEDRGDILQQMNVETAATYTRMLMN